MLPLDYPLWLRAAHFFNFLLLSLLVRSGLEILSAHPRLYWNDHCTPGSEWLKFTNKLRPKDRLWTASDEESSFPSGIALPGHENLGRAYGIRTLLCEGGPAIYGELLTKHLIDEDFRTISLQVLGKSTQPGIDRPTTYGDISYTLESAPWFRLISIHYALPHHALLRLRYEGTRNFQD